MYLIIKNDTFLNWNPYNVRMIKILSELVVKNKTSHLQLPIMTFLTDAKLFTELGDDVVNNDANYKEFVEHFNNRRLHRFVSIQFNEYCDCDRFDIHINNNKISTTLLHWKIYLFQIISTLAIIQYYYPDFRHNNLRIYKILVHKIDKTTSHHNYKVCGQNYRIPNIRYTTRINSSHFANITNIIDNVRMTSDWFKDLKITTKKNHYYDVNYLLNSLYMVHKNISPLKVKEFIKIVIPSEYLHDGNDNDNINKNINMRGRLIVDIEYMAPKDILLLDFFEEFRV